MFRKKEAFNRVDADEMSSGREKSLHLTTWRSMVMLERIILVEWLVRKEEWKALKVNHEDVESERRQ